MGIKVEFNPDLALRNISELNNRKKEECIPENLESGQVHEFLKQGQRNYWLEGEIPLLETKGNEQLSRPIASIIILECTHLLIEGKPFTLFEISGISRCAMPWLPCLNVQDQSSNGLSRCHSIACSGQPKNVSYSAIVRPANVSVLHSTMYEH